MIVKINELIVRSSTAIVSRIAMIRPSQAEAIERQLISLARSGQITRKLGDEELRSMLEQVSTNYSPIQDNLCRMWTDSLDAVCVLLLLVALVALGISAKTATTDRPTKLADEITRRWDHSTFHPPSFPPPSPPLRIIILLIILILSSLRIIDTEEEG